MKIHALPLLIAASAFAADPPEPKFRAVTIDDKIQIGYGLAIADVDGDKRPDILLADKRQIVWYRNPAAPEAAWSKHVIAENLTEKDNVCIAAEDIDGDGKCEIAIGAEWNPGDTEKSGAVFYLIAPADRTQPWTPVKFPSVEPTTHRMKWLKLDEGKWGLVVVPLHGRGNKNGEGVPVKVLMYRPPTPLNNPQGEWKSEVLDESLHMTHNFDIPRLREGEKLPRFYLGGKEDALIAVGLGDRTHTRPLGLRAIGGADFAGAGEIRHGRRSDGSDIIVTIEPMHGNRLVRYAAAPGGARKLARQVLTDSLSDGHALGTGDLLGIGSDQIVVGWRGTPGKAGSTIGVHVWTALDPAGEKWRDTAVDDTGMACEDLALADLDGDGRLDIIAAGRATKNVKVYFNDTPR